MSILQNIHGHDDLLRLNEEDRKLLCSEIREFLVSNVALTGGHLASNLGAVELTVAVETVFHTMRDRLVFDVGHQSYVHKLLTGRQADFAHLRQFGGISGFPKPSESDADAFVAGHASSSVSIALGMARARTLLNQDYDVVALLGDGSATGGMAYEGLNDAAVSREPMVIILNDNEMAIDRNVGGMSRHLSNLRTKEQYLGMKRRYRGFLQKMPGGKAVYRFTKKVKDWVKRMVLPATIFENMGLTYLGPVDGHDTESLITLLKSARDLRVPVVVHVITQKGRGYLPAEGDPCKFHGIGKFDPASGKSAGEKSPVFSDSFGETLVELAEEDNRVCAITAAMPGGTGLLKYMKQFPERYFDVGIAEEHAVSMAGGLAKQGMIPVVALYSTFLQRAFDQIIQDIALLKLHVVLAVDRAGLVGEDGATHHGIFDVGFLRQIPGMLILAPGSRKEQQDMLRWAFLSHNGPVAIRYPRGGNRGYDQSAFLPGPDVESKGQFTCHRRGNAATLVTYGVLLENVMQAAEILSQEGMEVTVLRLLTLSKLPTAAMCDYLPQGAAVFVAEEACTGSGISQALALELGQLRPDCRVTCLDLGAHFITHGSMNQLYEMCGLDGASIARSVKEVLEREN